MAVGAVARLVDDRSSFCPRMVFPDAHEVPRLEYAGVTNWILG